MSTDLGCCEFERRSCDIYHTHMCVHGLDATNETKISCLLLHMDMHVCAESATSRHHQTQLLLTEQSTKVFRLAQRTHVCWQQHTSTKHNNLNSTYLTRSALGHGVLTFHRTHVCALAIQAQNFWELVSQLPANKQTDSNLFCLLRST